MDRKHVWIAVVYCCIGILRLLLCCDPTTASGDLRRNLITGLVVLEKGPSAAGVPLVDHGVMPGSVAFANHRYNYPVIALSFFVLAAWVSPTLAATKLTLTLIELVNSWLIYKYTQRPMLSLLYWGAPVSVWWVSREGQFEPLQNCFALVALVFLKHGRTKSAGFMLSLAVQAKLTTLAIVFFFMYQSRKKNRRHAVWFGSTFIIGFFPTLIAANYFSLTIETYLTKNPYYWNPFDQLIYESTAVIFPLWVWDQIVSWILLGTLLNACTRDRDWIGLVAPLLFLVFVKTYTNIQPWYFISFPCFLLPMRNCKWRDILFVMWCASDLLSLILITMWPSDIPGALDWTEGWAPLLFPY